MMGLALALGLAAAQTTSPEPGSLQPEQASYQIRADGGTLSVRVTRAVGSTGPAGCTWTLVGQSATAGTDFTAATGALSWTSGDLAPKTVTIGILDASAGANRTFKFQLNTPTSGAWLGTPSSFPVVNHAGRTLGPLPAISGPLEWNTTQADSIVGNLQILPPNNPWNEDISDPVAYPVLGNSGAMITSIGSGTFLDYNNDMNFCIVPADQLRVTVSLFNYPGESDPGPYPIPDIAPIENWPIDDTRTLANIQQDIPLTGGDRHSLTLDPVNGYIYEFGQTSCNASFVWIASSEATFSLRSNTLRPDTWTSTDAAGLPILAAIPRYDECQRGMVEHALRFTVNASRHAYVYPATHQAAPAGNTSTSFPRMGERFRLKNTPAINTAIAAMSTHPKAIALALQKYGMFVADNGGSWRISVSPDSRLANLNELKSTFAGTDFEAIQTTGANQGPRAVSEAVVTITPTGSSASDTTPPSLAITTPAGPTFSASATPLAISGTASDDVGVTLVYWNTDQLQSGVASGVGPWNASIPLASGANVVTVSAMDAAGHATSSTLTVTYTPPPAPAGGGGGGAGGGGGGGGGCGLSGLELLPLLLFRRFRRHA
jgi:hypothetical protein